MKKLVLLSSLLFSYSIFAQLVTYTSTDFGEVLLNNTASLSFSVTNSTANAYDVSVQVATSSRPANNPIQCPPVSVPHISLSSSSNAQQTINNGETTTFVVDFTPSSYTTSGTMMINMGPGQFMTMCNPGITFIQSGYGTYEGVIGVTVSSGGNTIGSQNIYLTGVGVQFETTSVNEGSEVNSTLLFPNPTSATLNIAPDVEYITLKNSAGQTVLESMNIGALDISTLQPGMYYAELRNASGIQKMKVVKI
jgi:hypothetical protein